MSNRSKNILATAALVALAAIASSRTLTAPTPARSPTVASSAVALPLTTVSLVR